MHWDQKFQRLGCFISKLETTQTDSAKGSFITTFSVCATAVKFHGPASQPHGEDPNHTLVKFRTKVRGVGWGGQSQFKGHHCRHRGADKPYLKWQEEQNPIHVTLPQMKPTNWPKGQRHLFGILSGILLLQLIDALLQFVNLWMHVFIVSY